MMYQNGLCAPHTYNENGESSQPHALYGVRWYRNNLVVFNRVVDAKIHIFLAVAHNPARQSHVEIKGQDRHGEDCLHPQP